MDENTELDAIRYRWLRECHWSNSEMAVVVNPKKAMKLGHVAPFGSYLDAKIDAAMRAEKERKRNETD